MKKIQDYPDVSFIEEISFVQLQEQMITDYEERYKKLTGKEVHLAKADPYRLVLYACAVALYQGYQYTDKAGKMGLLKYSAGGFLDNLGSHKKVYRNEAKPAMTTLRFTLAEAISQTAVIPAGTRVKGLGLYFETIERGEIPTGSLTVDVSAQCQTAGMIGNDFREGEIKTLVDPLPYTLSVSNIQPTSGGTERETDEELAERIYLSPSSYSTAGPSTAYEYWVKTFSPAIQECRILSETPGEVDIYVTVNGEIPDNEFIKQLENYLEDHNIRPLTDHVVVKKPEPVTYDIELTYYIRNGDQNAEETIKDAVKTAAGNFCTWQKKIGRDITPAQLIYEVMQAGAQSVEVHKPDYAQLSDSQIAMAGTVTLNYGGLRDG